MNVGEGEKKVMEPMRDKRKNKDAFFPAEATFVACKILLQRADTGTH